MAGTQGRSRTWSLVIPQAAWWARRHFPPLANKDTQRGTCPGHAAGWWQLRDRAKILRCWWQVVPTTQSGPLSSQLTKAVNQNSKRFAHKGATVESKKTLTRKSPISPPSWLGDLFSSYIEWFSLLAYICSSGMFYMNCVKAWLMKRHTRGGSDGGPRFLLKPQLAWPHRTCSCVSYGLGPSVDQRGRGRN